MSISLEEKIESIDSISSSIPAVIIIHELTGNCHIKYMSQNGLDILKTTKDALYALTADEYHARYFSPIHAEVFSPKLFDILSRGDESQVISFFQQVRSSEEEEYKLYLTVGKIFMKNDKGIPTHMISMACAVDAETNITTKVTRLMEENRFLKENHQVFASLTRREKEILKHMALGHSSDVIAEKLHISETTVTTHRRNIRTKLGVTSNYDLVQFAQAFDLI